MTGRSRWTAVAAIALIAGVTACSAGDDDTAATATTDSTGTPPVAAPAATPAATTPAGNLPAGVTAEMVAAGETAFKTGICVACHGADATGTPNAPNLTDSEWLNNDGSYEQIQATIKNGVPTPKQHPTPMPPMGGAQLTDQQVSEIAAYIYSISHKS
jgi:cbb3-type cytochrome c oxidase subunit III